MTYSQQIIRKTLMGVVIISLFCIKPSLDLAGSTIEIQSLSKQCSLKITRQPVSQTDCYGNLVKFSVEVSGAVGVLNYQWQQRPPGGTFTDINGATNALLQVDQIGMNDQNIDGTEYLVIISDDCGSIISLPALLTVNKIASITPQKRKTNLCVGGDFSFKANTSGTVPISYQWIKNGSLLIDGTLNGTTIIGSSSSTLNVYGSSSNESGSYQIRIVFNVFDGVAIGKTCQITSQLERNVVVNSFPTPTLASSAVGNAICTGQSLTFTATGGSSYNFRINNISIQAGASNTFATTSFTNGQSIDVVVTSTEGCSATSEKISIAVMPYPDSNPIVAN